MFGSDAIRVPSPRHPAETLADRGPAFVDLPLGNTYQPPAWERPNIVVLTVGHSGSRLLVKMLERNGWAPQTNEYGELPSLARADAHLRSGRHEPAAELLSGLAGPWVLKHPAMATSFSLWQPHLLAHAPLLIWLRRQLPDIARAWPWQRDEHGEPMIDGQTISETIGRIATAYQQWPGRRLVVHFEGLIAAASLVDFKRARPVLPSTSRYATNG